MATKGDTASAQEFRWACPVDAFELEKNKCHLAK